VFLQSPADNAVASRFPIKYHTSASSKLHRPRRFRNYLLARRRAFCCTSVKDVIGGYSQRYKSALARQLA